MKRIAVAAALIVTAVSTAATQSNDVLARIRPSAAFLRVLAAHRRGRR